MKKLLFLQAIMLLGYLNAGISEQEEVPGLKLEISSLVNSLRISPSPATPRTPGSTPRTPRSSGDWRPKSPAVVAENTIDDVKRELSSSVLTERMGLYLAIETLENLKKVVVNFSKENIASIDAEINKYKEQLNYLDYMNHISR